MHEIESRRLGAIALSSKNCSGIGELALQLTKQLQELSTDSSLRVRDSLTNSRLHRAVLMRLHEDSGGAAAGLAAFPELVRALFRSAAVLQDTALMLLRKISSWETGIRSNALYVYVASEHRAFAVIALFVLFSCRKYLVILVWY